MILYIFIFISIVVISSSVYFIVLANELKNKNSSEKNNITSKIFEITNKLNEKTTAEIKEKLIESIDKLISDLTDDKTELMTNINNFTLDATNEVDKIYNTTNTTTINSAAILTNLIHTNMYYQYADRQKLVEFGDKFNELVSIKPAPDSYTDIKKVNVTLNTGDINSPTVASNTYIKSIGGTIQNANEKDATVIADPTYFEVLKYYNKKNRDLVEDVKKNSNTYYLDKLKKINEIDRRKSNCKTVEEGNGSVTCTLNDVDKQTTITKLKSGYTTLNFETSPSILATSGGVYTNSIYNYTHSQLSDVASVNTDDVELNSILDKVENTTNNIMNYISNNVPVSP